jgi:hypothetical protein
MPWLPTAKEQDARLDAWSATLNVAASAAHNAAVRNL